MLEIDASTRRALRAQAHHLHPVVSIGHQGLTPAVMHEIDVNLLAHGLIKLRVFSDDREVREALLARICEALDAAPVQHLGKVLVIYRPPQEEEEEPPPRRAPARAGSGKSTGAPDRPAPRKAAASPPGRPAKPREREPVAGVKGARRRATAAGSEGAAPPRGGAALRPPKGKAGYAGARGGTGSTGAARRPTTKSAAPAGARSPAGSRHRFGASDQGFGDTSGTERRGPPRSRAPGAKADAGADRRGPPRSRAPAAKPPGGATAAGTRPARPRRRRG